MQLLRQTEEFPPGISIPLAVGGWKITKGTRICLQQVKYEPKWALTVYHQLYFKAIQSSQASFSWQQLPAIHNFLTSQPRSCIWTFVCKCHAVCETIHSFLTLSLFDSLFLATRIPQHRTFVSDLQMTLLHTPFSLCLSLETSFYVICHRCRIDLGNVLSFRQEHSSHISFTTSATLATQWGVGKRVLIQQIV